MRDTTRYGQFYWCVRVTNDVSSDGHIYVMADSVEVVDGALLLMRAAAEDGKSRNNINLSIPAGKWTAVFAASLIDGSAIAVEHWKGEIYEDPKEEAEEEEVEVEKQKREPGRRVRDGPVRPSRSARYAVLERDGFKCQVCGRTQGDGVVLEVDHMTPVALGGDSSLANLQTLCRDCNRGKGTRGVTVVAKSDPPPPVAAPVALPIRDARNSL